MGRRSRTRQKHLFLCTDSLLAKTGFGEVARHIGSVFKDWRITQVGVNHPRGIDGVRPVETVGNTTIYAADWDKGSKYGEEIMLRLLREEDFDAVLVLQDLEVTNEWVEEWRRAMDARRFRGRAIPPTLYYFPIDGPVIREGGFLTVADELVVPTNWGARLAEKIAPIGREIHVIPHAVNTRVFKPVPKKRRAAARRTLFGTARDDRFVIGWVGSCTARKDPFQALQALQVLKDEYPQMRARRPLLYLHTSIDGFGVDVRCMATDLGLVPGADYALAAPARLGCPASDMRVIYAACDVLLNTSRRAGWEIPVPEAMAVGTPVVAPGYGPFLEHALGGGVAVVAVNDRLVWTRGDNRGRGWLSDPARVAYALAQVADRQGTSAARRARADGRAYAETLSYDNVAPLWRATMTDVLRRGPREAL